MTGPALDVDTGVSASVFGELSAAIGNLAREVRADHSHRKDLAADVWHVSAPAQSFTALPYALAGWGPKTGYVWAVQRISVYGFGATTDFVNLYRGVSKTDVLGQNGLYTLSIPVAGQIATWHPGRTGLVLMGDQGLVLGGTFTGTIGYVSADVIQLTESKLPYFLL